MNYGEYLEQWQARMAAKYGSGTYPDFAVKEGASGRSTRTAALLNRVNTASQTWRAGETREAVSNLTPRASEKAMARTQPKPPDAEVIPLRRGA